jgi:hypothetical protein
MLSVVTNTIIKGIRQFLIRRRTETLLSITLCFYEALRVSRGQPFPSFDDGVSLFLLSAYGEY